MASSAEGDDESINIVCTSPNQFEAETADKEILISITDIVSWDFPTVLSHGTIKIQAQRKRLVENSSYFQGLLSGSFCESHMDHISVQWNLEIFLNILKCIYGCQIDITPNNFLQFYEGALYFGVQMLLEKCRTWFSEEAPSKVPPQIELDNLISIWNFSFDHAYDVLPKLCAIYLAKTFVWATSSKLFVNLPYRLLQSSIMQQHLTIESEMHLSVALFSWFDANIHLEDLSGTENDYTSILKQVHVSLLPLWFAAGKRNSRFSKFVDASIHSIFILLEVPSTGSINVLGDGDLCGFRIRLTEFSEKVSLSSCPQITSTILLLDFCQLCHLKQYKRWIFPSVKLHLESSIECFSVSFPSLKTLKATYLLNFDISFLHHLVKKCLMVCEVDQSTNISQVEQLPNITPSPAKMTKVWNYSPGSAVCMSNQQESNITILILEGRSELRGKRNSRFSRFADASIHSIFTLLEVPSTGSINVLGDGDLCGFRIRLTEFSKKVDLSSCPQITSAILLLSMLPSLYNTEPTLWNTITKLPFNLEHFNRDHSPLSQGFLPTMSFEAVQEVDISKCQRLHLESAIECFSVSFPSLKTLKAAYLLNFDISFLHHLVKKCSMVCEVDLSTDISPVEQMHLSTDISSVEQLPHVTPSPAKMTNVWNYSSGGAVCMSNQSESNITKLTLEGRSELREAELMYVAEFCVSLQYLNIKGCVSLTDVGIARLLYRCLKLESIVACGTAFGTNSVQALCSNIDYGNTHPQLWDSVASNLRTLHIGGCKGVDEACLLKLLSRMHMLKSLCLRDTCIVDHALYSFAGSSLEMLDVSNTMVTGVVLAYIVCKNPALKCLRVRGCRNLSQQENNTERGEISSSYSFGDLEVGLGKTCRLEEISFGWGFSYFSMKALKPAITSLRAITVGLGASLGEDVLIQLPSTCPILESIILYFQVISDSVIESIVTTLRNLQVLVLCYCLGDISILGFKFSMPNLRKLQLKRVTPWLTNNDLVILTQSCPNLIELSLLGCKHLNSDSQQIISRGWPGLISIHLEDCGEVTTNGINSLLHCVALEDLLLRHNGAGIPRNFIHTAASRMPLLRKVALDLCDAKDGIFDISRSADMNYISIVKIASCRSRGDGSSYPLFNDNKRPMHKETHVAVWNGQRMVGTVIEERV